MRSGGRVFAPVLVSGDIEITFLGTVDPGHEGTHDFNDHVPRMWYVEADVVGLDGRDYHVGNRGSPTLWHAIAALIREYLRDRFVDVITGKVAS